LDYYYLDNGYFPKEGRFFRVTRNNRQSNGESGPTNHERLTDLGVRFLPWNKAGRIVLICLQSEGFYRLLLKTTVEKWLEDVLATLRKHTDRKIVIREKPWYWPAKPLAWILSDCHAVVTHSSNCAIEAVCTGVPAFVTTPCGALAVSSTDLTKIESPYYPDDREAWAARLAAQQWTLDEMRSGRCWRDLENS
jgi:hypothetical protein